MGRKPNALILEFFTRGAKLEDSSNRYHHTCKACGEEFPKGRIDSLTNHLVKKCQAISLRDRKRVLLRLHDLDPSEVDGESDKGKSDSGFPNPNGPNFDGLNVLAEASRQVGASDTTKRGYQSVTSGGKMVVVDPSLEEGYQGQTQQGSPNGSPHHSIPALPSHTSGDHNSMSPTMVHQSMSPESAANGLQSQSLSLIAASANEMVPQGLVDGEHDVKMSWNPHLTENEQILLRSLQEHDPTLTATTQRAAAFPRPIAMNPNTQAKGFVNEFGNSTKPAKPKVRGRFTAERRREVQEVRKQGACIRCRMLKKPCSGDTPCTTCASVESARLWKQPCIRTRLAEEFDLYNANLHTTLAYHDISAIKSQIKFEHYGGRIDVTHAEESGVMFMTATGLQGHRTSNSALDPQLQAIGDQQFSGQSQEIYLLDTDAEDVTGKLEIYLKKSTSMFIDRETSPLIKPTMLMAAELLQEKKDPLLERAIELWVATHILVNTDISWKAFINPNYPPTSMHLTQPNEEGRIPIKDPESVALLCCQLRAAVEKRAMALSKSVINDLERRLLQRQKSGWFETFMIAIVLLNAVERTTWLYRSWDNESFVQRVSDTPFIVASGQTPSVLLQSVSTLCRYPGDVVAHAEPSPKTTVRPETGTLRMIDGSEEHATKWLDLIQVTPFFIEQRMSTAFDPNDTRSLDFVHIARLLMPPA
ncbi:hypothetical protein N7495_005661 [Penicillium taxi]|uniref:uncharacterized protein n=1 Tax=Penicillium taxi TaxID=168475 RepID=UPI0025456051|nr:uncharacterized protein N7495_005661 [Penicillium taxi]KAJ5893970.1 hypothetical protein N7495_005661 [Penicillium taxi]